MVVLDAFDSALRAVRRNPILVAVVFAASLLQLPALVAQSLAPPASLVASLFSTVVSVLVTPFVFGGLIGLASEALDGEANLDAFVAAGRDNYLTMLGAYLLFVAALVVVSIVAGIGGTVVGLAAFAAGGSGGALAGIVVGLVALVVVGGFTLLAGFFVQFYGHAIVLDDRGVVDAFRRSAGLVRRNLVTVAGYSLVVFGLGLVVGTLGGIAPLLGPEAAVGESLTGLPSLSATGVVALQAAGTVVGALVGSVFLPFSVAIYRAITGSESDAGSTTVGAADPA